MLNMQLVTYATHFKRQHYRLHFTGKGAVKKAKNASSLIQM